MSPLTNPWVLTLLVIMAVVLAFLVLRVVHRLRHGKTSTEFAPLPVIPRAQAEAPQPSVHDDGDPLLAKGA